MAKPSPALHDTRLVDAMIDALPGTRRWPEALKNGWRIKRTDGQIASSYVSDNALGDTSEDARENAVELALNPERLVEMPLERPALLRWLHHQRQCFGERKFNIHQRGDPVTWFRMGFATLDEALIFLRGFKTERTMRNIRERWNRPEGAVVAVVETQSGGAGNRNNEELAAACIPVLIAHIMSRRDEMMATITYEDLAEQLNRRDLHGNSLALGMGDVLGRVMVYIDRPAALLQEEVTYLTTIMVDKSGPDCGLSGVGVGGRWTDYPSLSRAEKADLAELEYLRILRFSRRWYDVLSVLGLPGEPPPLDPRAGRAGGESPSTKRSRNSLPPILPWSGHRSMQRRVVNLRCDRPTRSTCCSRVQRSGSAWR
jgi:hypothetical protein